MHLHVVLSPQNYQSFYRPFSRKMTILDFSEKEMIGRPANNVKVLKACTSQVMLNCNKLCLT